MHKIQNDLDHSSFAQDQFSTIGRILKQEREHQGLSCQSLAHSLHMGEEQLQALENGVWENLPEPVFVQGMLRRVAAKLGLDPTPLVHQFQSQLKEINSSSSRRFIPDKLRHSDDPRRKQTASPVSRRLKTAAIPLVFIAAITFGAIAFHINRQQGLQMAAEPLQTKAVVQAEPQVDSLPVVETIHEVSGSIAMMSSQPSWVSIRNAKGDLVFEGTLSEPKRFDSDQGLEVFAGRPDLVQVGYGAEAPRALGTIDQLRWYSLTPESSP